MMTYSKSTVSVSPGLIGTAIRALSPAACCLLLACGAAPRVRHAPALPPKQPTPLQPIPYGKLVGSVSRIVAEDGSFTINAGQVFRPPFSMGTRIVYLVQKLRRYSRRSAYWLIVPLASSRRGRCVGNYCALHLGSPMRMVDTALRYGARKVRVYVRGRTNPLYGVLYLGRAPASATGPEARSYLINIPSGYVRAASGGRASVVYETIKFPVTPGSSLRAEVYGWILWMSDVPFGR